MACQSRRRCAWSHSMLRVGDADASLRFYCGVLGMTLVHRVDAPDDGVSVMFLQSLPLVHTESDANVEYQLNPNSKEAREYVLSSPKPMLKLWCNRAEQVVYHPGNEKGDGFGHIAFAVDDVFSSCDRLEKAGIRFRKRPDEGRMKGLAFVLDPDGYWVEVVRRASPVTTSKLPEFSFAQTMLRVKDPKASCEFYTRMLSMVLVNERHFNDFSLYFLACKVPTLDGLDLPPKNSEQAAELVRSKLYPLGYPVLELTHNHGTENQPDFSYDNGNSTGRLGFGHLGFVVDEVNETCDLLAQAGARQQTRSSDDENDFAVMQDPDGYLIQIVKNALPLVA